MLQNYHTEFLTGTIFNWVHLLKEDIYKQIVVDSFQWLVEEKKCIINAFVIMPNHFHLIWKISDGCWTKTLFRQKLNYTHFTPCQPHWNLADVPEDYKYSSARFYETGIKKLGFITHFNVL